MSINVLSPAGMRALRDFVDEETAFAFDYDGTLAPLVADPKKAYMREHTRRLLQRLLRQRTGLLLTGRSVGAVSALTRRLPFELVMGSHGAEWSNAAHDAPELDHAWRARLGAAIAEFPGAIFEDKRHSVSVHVREVKSVRARRAIARLVRQQMGLRVVPGKEVYNLVPKAAMDKGRALIRARRDLHLGRVVFVGDDITDEDVFRLRQPWLFSIRVGPRRRSHARYHLRAQPDIDTFLETCCDLEEK